MPCSARALSLVTIFFLSIALAAPAAASEGPDEVPRDSLGFEVPTRSSGAEVMEISLRLSLEPLRDTAVLPGTRPISLADYRMVLAPIYVEVPERYAAQGRRRTLASRGAPVARASLDIAPIVLECASRYDLDPMLILSIIEVESNFQASAVSPVGAGGLMQLMPETASGLGCRDRFDPAQNIRAGSAYLRLMLNEFGKADLAIAAYNAGPGAVAKYGGVPPYRETQGYVVKVRDAWQRRLKGS